MRLKQHKIEGVQFSKARWTGNEITPKIVVLHDTASRLDEGQVASYLLNNNVKVSVHFVIERDGTIVQQVQTNLRANHAGRSHYHGRDHCNGFSVGIEIVNPGRMTRGGSIVADGVEGYEHELARAWFGKTFGIDAYGIQEVTTPQHGHGLWMPYTEEQLAAVVELLQALFKGIETLEDVVTHWYVSPGRKIDTNPLFPLEHIRSLILGRRDPADELADAASAEALASSDEEFVQIDVYDSGLNMRRWPSFNNNILREIPDGATVPVIRRGKFDGRMWIKVFFDGQEGWIVERYTAAVSVRTPRRASSK